MCQCQTLTYDINHNTIVFFHSRTDVLFLNGTTNILKSQDYCALRRAARGVTEYMGRKKGAKKRRGCLQIAKSNWMKKVRKTKAQCSVQFADTIKLGLIFSVEFSNIVVL